MLNKITHLLTSPVFSSISRFRWVAWVEGVSYLMLGITMILKYKYDMPFPNKVVGMSHGVLFITYVFLLVSVALKYSWSGRKVFWGFVASLLPFGTFYADAKLFKFPTKQSL